jgi:fatty-acyl-CoA synthase
MNPFATVGQPYQLLIKHLLDRPLNWAPGRTIHYRELKQATYREFYSRVQRLANLLTGLGVRAGDRVGVMDVDSHRYLELFFAVPMIGAVLHTINVRLSAEQIHYTILHAEDKVLFLHADFIRLAEPFLSRFPEGQSLVLMSDDSGATVHAKCFRGEYEQLLAEAPAEFAFPEFDERTVATLFYTTGTTGDPKGVFFTHRQLVLHTMAVGLMLSSVQQPLGVSSEDVYMPLTPMFHAHAWGVPYIATLLGLKQVYPGRYEVERLLRLIAEHGVTLTHCVPTMVQMLLHHPASRQVDLSRFKLLVGGSALSEGLARQAMDRGIRILGAYGMSETCPVLTAAQLQPTMANWEPHAQIGVITRAGLPAPLVQAQIWDPDGKPLPPGREHPGELVVRAPWLTPGYFKEEQRSRELWRGGWLHTGDVAYFDEEGYVRITDRLKDVIKVGGEWLSSLELENALSRHEAVKEAAVVAQPDQRWGERPYAEVVLREEKRDGITPKDLAGFLHQFIDRGQLHKRAILTEIRLVDALPRTSVGKLDKKAIRARSLTQTAPPPH